MNTPQQELNIHFSDIVNRVLVTGGTGFIGQQLIAALLKNGQEVILLTRKPTAASKIFGTTVHYIQSVNDLADDFVIDIIINLAGARILGWRWTASRKKVLLESRVKTTQSIVDWIAKAKRKPTLFLSASAIGYYGIQAQTDLVTLTEEGLPQSIFMSTLCQQWEATAQKAADYGVSVNIMRFGLVLGKQGALPMLLLPIKLYMGGPLGSGIQIISWIHITDLLRAIAHVWKLHSGIMKTEKILSIYNFTAPEAPTQKEFTKIAAKLLHKPAFFPTPALPVQLMLGEQSDLLLEGQRVAPANLLATGFAFKHDNVEAALRDLI